MPPFESPSPSSVSFEDGELAITVTKEPSPFRMRECRAFSFRLSEEDVAQLAQALTAWLEDREQGHGAVLGKERIEREHA